MPALRNEVRTAKIRWVGAQVEAVKRSVPLTAELPNGRSAEAGDVRLGV